MGMMNNGWHIVKPSLEDNGFLLFRHPIDIAGEKGGGWMTPSTENQLAAAQQDTGVPNKRFTRQEIEKHSSKDGACWLVINEKVYDATSVLSWHPGGSATILTNTGKLSSEVTELPGRGPAGRRLLQLPVHDAPRRVRGRLRPHRRDRVPVPRHLRDRGPAADLPESVARPRRERRHAGIPAHREDARVPQRRRRRRERAEGHRRQQDPGRYPLGAELDGLAGKYPDRLRIAHVLSHPKTENEWTGLKGHVDAEMIRRNCFPPGKESVVFLCGPPPMIQKAALPALKGMCTSVASSDGVRSGFGHFRVRDADTGAMADWGYKEDENCFGF